MSQQQPHPQEELIDLKQKRERPLTEGDDQGSSKRQKLCDSIEHEDEGDDFIEVRGASQD